MPRRLGPIRTHLNRQAARLAMEDIWLRKAEAARFFLRRSSTDEERFYASEERLLRAVDEGRIRTRPWRTKTLYNAWDCLRQGNIL